METNLCIREELDIREETAELTIRGNVLSGYAIVYNQPSRIISERGKTFREIIKPGAFTESISRQNITFQFRHNEQAVYGDTQSGGLRLHEDEKGLKFDLDLPPYAQHLREQVETKNIKGMSFGFRPTKESWDGSTRSIHQGELDHVAAVYAPCYPQTSIALRSDSSMSIAYARLRLAESEI